MAKKEINYQGTSYSLSYEMINLSSSKTILFLHGWGSNKEIMKQAFGTVLKEYRHLYLDLPGFGSSSIHNVIDTQAYVDIVKVFLSSLDIVPDAIFGHSFGGKIATLLEPKKLVLLSSAGIVIPKPFKIKIKIALFKLLKPFSPKGFYKFFATKDVEGMSQTMYEILKKVVNEDWSQYFLACKSKTFIFWGKEDKATPLSSGEKIHQMIKYSIFIPMDGEHFFFVRSAKEIEKLLVESKF